MKTSQLIVAVGAASGVAAMAASVWGLYQRWPLLPGLNDVASRLGYAAELNLFAVLPLVVMILVVANTRFLSEAIDPTLRKESRAMEVDGRVLDNTLQQTLLFCVGVMALSVQLTGAQMRVIPAATVVFVAARLLFWIGYRIGPLYRAFGMAATGYLNVGILGFAIWRFLS